MNYEEIKEVILKCKNKVNLKIYSIDFAKGYCSGVLNTSNKINEDEYNELYKIIDDEDTAILKNKLLVDIICTFESEVKE